MIPLFKVFMSEESIEYTTNVLRSGYIGEGKIAKQFEDELSRMFGYNHIRLTNSATSAIDIALHMIGVGQNDEFITTPITCTASNSNAANRGARLVWADVDPSTGLIDPHDVARKITKRTKAIMGVNWGGAMPDYGMLKSFGIPVIEDAAHGPYWSNKVRGDYIVWSFQAIKHLTSGDGGALWNEDHNRIRMLRWFGLDRESKADFRCDQNIKEIGYKYHMNDINAAIGLGNIKYLETLIANQNYSAFLYDTYITNPKILKPKYDKDNPFWLYTVRTKKRDEFVNYLKDNGIASSMVHARNDKHIAFKRISQYTKLPGVDSFNNTQVSIPVGWWLSEDDRRHIIGTINAY